MMNKATSLTLLFLSLFITSCHLPKKDSAKPEPVIENLTQTAPNHFTCTYCGNKRSFILCLPENAGGELQTNASIANFGGGLQTNASVANSGGGLQTNASVSNPTPTSLILMLHGYGSNGESFQLQTHFDGQAAAHGYAVAYVDGTGDPEDKTSAAGWNSGIKDSPKDDIGFLSSLASALQEKYGFSDKVFAAGFSNGAFMIHRLALETEKFTAVASVAGFCPLKVWENRPEQIKTGILQINGTKDDVVPMKANGSARFNKNPAIEDVMDYYKTAFSFEKTETFEPVRHILIKDGRHSWPEKAFCGFDVNEEILNYFDSF